MLKIAVVDGYSTGRILVEALRARGATCFHVCSSPDMPPFFTRGFRADDYARNFRDRADPAALAHELTSLGVTRVVAGTESGVLLADTLTHLMGLPGNLPETGAARRDKVLMAEAVAEAGLAVPLGRAFQDEDAAVNWFRTAGLEQAVVKPPSSAGSDNVRFCRTADDVLSACRSVLTSRNLYAEPNASVLVQERLSGVEYYINTVSHAGVHRIAEMWRYTKRHGAAGSPVYDFEEPVLVRSDEASSLRTFVPAVLDALGVVSGAAHTEVMVTGRGPVLIESGARLGGATAPWVVEKHSGMSQTSLFAETLVTPDRLEAFDDAAIDWSGAVRNVSFINAHAGQVRSLDWVDRIRALPTLAEVSHGLVPGAALAPTTSLIDSPGFVYLVADDPSDVERDYRELRAMEHAGLYTS